MDQQKIHIPAGFVQMVSNLSDTIKDQQRLITTLVDLLSKKD